MRAVQVDPSLSFVAAGAAALVVSEFLKLKVPPKAPGAPVPSPPDVENRPCDAVVRPGSPR